MPYFQGQFKQTTVEVRTWVSDYIPLKHKCNTNPFPTLFQNTEIQPPVTYNSSTNKQYNVWYIFCNYKTPKTLNQYCVFSKKSEIYEYVSIYPIKFISELSLIRKYVHEYPQFHPSICKSKRFYWLTNSFLTHCGLVMQKHIMDVCELSVQVMASLLLAPRHYLNLCYIFIN